MATVKVFDACEFCGEVLRIVERFKFEPGDAEAVRDLTGVDAVGEWVWLSCVHGCTEAFVRAEEALPS